MDLAPWLQVNPEIVERLVLLVNQVAETDPTVGDEVVGRHRRVVPDREPDLARIPQQVRGEGLVPGGLFCLGLGARPLYGHLVHVDGHIGVQHGRVGVLLARRFRSAQVQPGHEVGVLELLGPAHRDLEPAVEHDSVSSVFDAFAEGKVSRHGHNASGKRALL